MPQRLSTDVAIIGAGPVGLFAVFECGMVKVKAHVIDALDMLGGQCAALYPEKPIFDIPGHPRIDAQVLIDKLAEQVDQRRAAQDANLQAAAKLGPDVLGYLTVQQVLVAHKVPLNKIFLFDQYFIPTNDKFVFNEVSPAVFGLWKTGQIYRPEQNDCDDDALMAMVAARRAYFGKGTEKRPVALLFGEFHYIRVPGGGHAINCFISKQNGEFKLEFFEPQQWKILQLTDAEIASCTFCRF